MHRSGDVADIQVNCRIGSLEKNDAVRNGNGGVNCRIGSLETSSVGLISTPVRLTAA